MKTSFAVNALQALAQNTRLTAFRLLVAAGPDGLPAGRIAGRLGIEPSVLSFHLGHLAKAGLVTSRRAGRQVIYRAAYDVMDALMDYLVRNCCRGVDTLSAAPDGASTAAAREQEQS